MILLRRAPLTLAVLVAASPVLAQAPAPAAPAPVGVASCDLFLAAYEACAASPGVPEVARAPMREGIEASRTTWREAIARDQRARRTVANQCAQSWQIVVPRLKEAFGCAFPPAPAP